MSDTSDCTLHDFDGREWCRICGKRWEPGDDGDEPVTEARQRPEEAPDVSQAVPRSIGGHRRF